MPFQEFGSFRGGSNVIKSFRDLTVDTFTLSTEMLLRNSAVIRSDNYVAATAGFKLDSGGDAEFNGNVFVSGEMQLNGGNFRTDDVNSTRWEFNSSNGTEYLFGYTLADNETFPGYLYISGFTAIGVDETKVVLGAVALRNGYAPGSVKLLADYDGASTWTHTLSFDNWDHIWLGAGTGWKTSPTIHSNGVHLFTAGAVGAPSIGYQSDTDTGIYFPATAQIAMTIGSTQEMLLTSTAFKVPNVYNSTTANAGNVYVASDGQMYRSTASGSTFGDGSQGAPSITFTSDTDTGIYRYSTNAIGFTTGGTMDAYFSGGYLYIPAAYSGTTSLAPNMYIASSGQFYRSTYAVSNFTSSAHTSAHTAIQSVYPSANNTYGLGWSSYRWRDLYVVGGTTAGSTDIHINASTGQLLQVTSSKRFKKHIKDYDGGLELLSKMRPRSFQWKKGMDDGNNVEGTQHIGMIAEELVEVAPEYVNLDEDGTPWSIRYSALVVPLLQAVQELNQRLTNVEQRGTV